MLCFDYDVLMPTHELKPYVVGSDIIPDIILFLPPFWKEEDKNPKAQRG